MKTNQSGRLPGQYLAALRIHFEQGATATLVSARAMGGRAVKRGLETLDLAKIHSHALAALILPGSTEAVCEDMTARGALFFAEANMPIEETHLIVTDAAAQLAGFRKTLDKLTLALADSQRDVHRETEARKRHEARLKSSGTAFDELLARAHTLETHLRDTAHTLISASEEERKLVSLQLQDEIAQTLLGIQIRLHALKGEISSGNTRLHSEIKKTRLIVEHSLKSITQFVRALGTRHED